MRAAARREHLLTCLFCLLALAGGCVSATGPTGTAASEQPCATAPAPEREAQAGVPAAATLDCDARVAEAVRRLDPSASPAEKQEWNHWTCFTYTETNPEGTRAEGHCVRTLEYCEVTRFRLRHPSRTEFTKCTEQDQAYCLLLKRSQAELVQYLCAPTLALCETNHAIWARNRGNEFLTGCTLRD